MTIHAKIKPDNNADLTKVNPGQAASGGLMSDLLSGNTDNKSLTKTEQKILLYLSSHPEATQQKIAEHLGSGRTAVANHIANLQAKGYLQRMGSRKKGSWVVLNPEELGL